MNSHHRLALVLGLLFAAGCGQKGALYLPGDPSLIKTEVPPPVQNQTEEDDEDKEEESQDENYALLSHKIKTCINMALNDDTEFDDRTSGRAPTSC